MSVQFQRSPHPRIEARKREAPPKSTDKPEGFNGRLALVLTTAVGTMWCAYAFAVLALVALPDALRSGAILPIITWVSQTFIQLVMLSVIMVGQNIQSRASDRRSEMTYKDADATFHEAEQIQKHLLAQDKALDDLMARVERMQDGAAGAGGAAGQPG